ncbi:hypothetical protein AWB78_04923 [Caballeronia calidae]|uniref:Uncharacterized protein n=1 Tax=Caballeronia calidae TaxID=1777139 RepID=A0A158DAC7_9BURK|nr:hypothetical protein [Caballeronia calidae]SAK91441.1 hypothetical protein AWB78_04923 [Caballeronia calidae]
MKVSALISKLSELDPDAEVLLLSGPADISGADELRRVEQQDEWRCEIHFRDDGLSQSLYAPSSFGQSMGFDKEYVRTVNGPVVLLAAYNANLDYVYVDDFASNGGTLGQERLDGEILRNRREMLEDGRLISRESLLHLLDITPEQLDILVGQGRIFAVIIDGASYYPSIFANPRVNAERLQSICRLLQPISDTCKLDFLLSAWGHLGGRRPIEMLDDEKDYRRVRQSAAVRVQESTRTFVKIFQGCHASLPQAEPVYTAAADIDPRRPLWSRARATLSEFGYQYPYAPYPSSSLFTAFVEMHFEGTSDGALEGAVCVHRDDHTWRILAVWPAVSSEMNEPILCEEQDVVSVAMCAFERLKKLSAS